MENFRENNSVKFPLIAWAISFRVLTPLEVIFCLAICSIWFSSTPLSTYSLHPQKTSPLWDSSGFVHHKHSKTLFFVGRFFGHDIQSHYHTFRSQWSGQWSCGSAKLSSQSAWYWQPVQQSWRSAQCGLRRFHALVSQIPSCLEFHRPTRKCIRQCFFSSSRLWFSYCHHQHHYRRSSSSSLTSVTSSWHPSLPPLLP